MLKRNAVASNFRSNTASLPQLMLFDFPAGQEPLPADGSMRMVGRAPTEVQRIPDRRIYADAILVGTSLMVIHPETPPKPGLEAKVVREEVDPLLKVHSMHLRTVAQQVC